MPQLSLYLDEDIHRELETRAKLNKTSISRFVVNTLKIYFSKNWPEGYQNTFASIDDESFKKQNAPDWSLDAPREVL